MIPHPLTLLFCYLLGQMAAQAIGTVLDFAMQVLFDFRRFGWLSPGGLILAVRVLVWTGRFLGGFGLGFSMRWLAEDSWRKAALWAALATLLTALFRAPAGPSLILNVLGCALGAYACERERYRPGLQDARGFLRGWMLWER